MDYILIKHIGFSYQDVRKMPILKKINFYNLWEKEQQEKQRMIEEEQLRMESESQEIPYFSEGEYNE